jgi:uncharacterized protein YidB (DUF937 family)
MALSGSQRGAVSPLTLALIGVLAYRTMHGKGRLAEMLGMGAGGAGPGGSPPADQPQTGAVPGSVGNLGGLGGVGGLLRGVLGGSGVSGGLQDLLKQFQQNGHGDKAESWLSSSANKPVSPPELEQALGDERIQWLMHQTGLPRDQLLAGLSQQLPGLVDRLTPDGRIPTAPEADALLGSG